MDDTTFVPLRMISENIGCTVDWNGSTQQVKITQGQKIITLQIGENHAQVNDHDIFISSPPCLISDTTYVPLRFITENLSFDVFWNGDTRTVNLTQLPENPIKITTKRVLLERPTLSIDLQYPALDGLNDPTAQANLNKLFADRAEAVNQEAVANEKDLVEGGWTQIQTTAGMDYTIKYNRNNIICVFLEIYTYAGGAHPMTYHETYTFDLATGQQLQLKDLFTPGYDYMAVINPIIKQGFAGNDMYLLTPFETIRPDGDFYITTDSLIIYFQLYEYTPYVYGFPEFTIPYGELQEHLKFNLAKKD